MKIGKFVHIEDNEAEKKAANLKQPVADSRSSPPAYSEATRDRGYASYSRASSSAVGGPQPVLSRPTNYLTLIRDDFPIRGTYRLDPTLPIPPGAIISKDREGKELNMKFNSTNGLVETCIEIIRGPLPATGPVRLEAVSINCDVTATVYDRQQNRFRLCAISQTGSVIVNIPPTFIGSVFAKLNRGAVKFGTEIQEQLTILSEQNNESRYFIGDYLATGYRDDESWTLDHLYVESGNGTVVIKFIEPERTSRSQIPTRKPRKKGFLRRLLG